MSNLLKFPAKAKEVVSRPILPQLIQQREGGGKKMLSYISGSTVIDLLNEAFGYLWSWQATEQWIQQSQPKKKYQSTEMEAVGPVAHVRGILTVLIENENGQVVEINKTGYGSKTVIGGQTDQESIFKAAGTDALKKAASLFGIGAQLYRNEDEQAFFDYVNYEDPWTEEALVKFEPERTFIQQVMKSTSSTQEDMNAAIRQWNPELTSIEDLVPQNIQGFVTWLKENVEMPAVS